MRQGESRFFAARLKTANFLGFLSACFIVVVQPLYLLPQEQVLPIFLSLMLVFIYLRYPLIEGGGGLVGSLLDVLLALISPTVGLYIVINYEELFFERAGLANPTDVLFGVLAVLLVLEAVRRSTGMAMALITIVFILYAFLGPFAPELIAHKGYGVNRLVSKLYLTNEGLYGLPLKVLIQYVVLFMIFGSFLESTGAAQFLTDLARSLTGGMTGGIAKVAVVASALEGTASGSAVANVVGSGSVTIPAMKQAGYAPHFAAAVEAVASTGGQIMPPVMGAAAFLMADFLETRYSKVALAAVLPACLYFLAAFLAIHFYATRNRLYGEPRDQLPRLWDVLRARGYFLLPIIGIVYALGKGYSPMIAGYAAIILSFLTSWMTRESRMGPRRLYLALSKAGQGFGEIAAASACAGVIMGILGLTGLGTRLSGVLIELSGHSTLLLLTLTAITSLIMGMGVPTTVAYITLATLVAPALTDLGTDRLASHLFIFYFGMVSMVTPPVAMAAYAAAAIARCDYNKVGWMAFRFVLPSLFVAYFFVYNPEILLGGGIRAALVPTLRCIVATTAMTAALSGWLIGRANVVQRLLLFGGALAMFHVNLPTDLLGVGALSVAGCWQWIEKRSRENVAAGAEKGAW